MDKDKLTTVLGTIVAILIGSGVVTQEQASTLQQAIGIITTLAIAAWGYFTNKS